MTISARIRRVAAIAVAALALGIGAFGAAPAQAQAGGHAGPVTGSVTGSARVETGPVNLATRSTPSAAATTISYNCSWSDLAAQPTYIKGGIFTTPGVFAFAIEAGGYQTYQGGTVTCDWSNGIQQTLALQGDSNFCFYVNNGKEWCPTPDIRSKKGTYVSFQGDGNLVVYNSTGTAVWASNTHTYPDAILAFQSDGNLVIYPSANDFSALWDTGTQS
jgi:hypothetical protein